MASKSKNIPKLTSLAGKSAMFVRGFGEYLKSQNDKGLTKAPLRKAQDAGLAYVTSKGDVISVPYISQLSSRMEADGIYTKTRMGKSFMVTWTEESLDKLLDLLEDEDYGTPNAGTQVTVEDVKARSEIIEHLDEFAGVVIRYDAPVPKAAYKLLWDRFNKGELVMAFVNNDQDLHDDFPLFIPGASVRTLGDDDE